MKPLRIGVDFDNTVVSYEGIFYKAALEKKLIPAELSPLKGAIRDYLFSLDKAKAWTELQGYVYGAKMDSAFPYQGVETFFSRCVKRQIPVFIISHKTEYPFLGPAYDLHKAAKDWLERQTFSPITFFELTPQAKFERIRQQECTVFIDDLPELLQNSAFPPNVHKILFDPHQFHSPSSAYKVATSWDEICQILKVYGP